MMHVQWNRLFFLLLFGFAACTPGATPTPTPAPTATPLPEISAVCFVTDVGSVNDGTFNQFAYEGLLSVTEDYDIEDVTVIETETEEDYERNIQTCLEEDADVVVTTGFLLQEPTAAAARSNPDVFFIGIDHNVAALDAPPSNYVGVQFREDQAGFLVGVMAALLANQQGADVIAGIYGVDVPAVKRFRNGFEQGALYVNPNWEVGENILGHYADSFTDRAQGEARAQEYIDAGAAVIFGAGGPLGSAGIVYAAQRGVLVIGVDHDEFYTTFQEGEVEGSEYLISSALKRVDQGVYDTVEMLVQGRFQEFPGGGNYTLGAARGGIGFAEPHDAQLDMEIQRQVTAALQGLVSGEISTNVDLETGELMAPEATEEATDEAN